MATLCHTLFGSSDVCTACPKPRVRPPVRRRVAPRVAAVVSPTPRTSIRELHKSCTKRKNNDGETNCQITSNYVKFDSQRSQNSTKMPFGTWIKSC